MTYFRKASVFEPGPTSPSQDPAKVRSGITTLYQISLLQKVYKKRLASKALSKGQSNEIFKLSFFHDQAKSKPLT